MEKRNFSSIRVAQLAGQFEGEQRAFILSLLSSDAENYKTLIAALTDLIAESIFTNYIDFNTEYTGASQEARLQWNPDAGTLDLGMPGGNVNGQLLQEFLKRVTNATGSTILNGTPVYVSGEQGNNLTIAPADASFSVGVAFRTYAVATEDILAGQKGYVTKDGVVRDINMSSFSGGDALYLAVGGSGAIENFYTLTPPAAPNVTILLGVVEKSTSAGELDINITPIPNLTSLSDVETTGLSNDDILAWNASNDTWDSKTPTSHTQLAFSMYDAEPARSSETSLDGAFIPLATNQPLDSVPTDIVVSKGTGKLVVAVNAGSDFAGTITVTGTSVDRDTGATTALDTDTITVDALTTDNSDTDTNGNTRHALIGAYISSKWFVGSVTLSTTDLTLTDVDVYHVSFEQFDDTANIVLDTFDANILTTSVNAEFDAYLYSIEVTGDKCNISREASLHVGADGETAIAARYWRLRRGNLNKAIDGTTDGTWVDVHYSNSPAFVEDVSVKVWATEIVPLTLT